MNSEYKFISSDINSNISKFIKIAIESSSIESFYKIDSFCLKILRLSIQNKDLNSYKQYLLFVNNYYLLSYADSIQKNKNVKEIHEICNDRSSRRIRETFFVLNVFYNRSNLEEKKYYNFFKLSTFTAFSQLLFEAVKRKDINFFNYTLNQIENVFLGKSVDISYFIYNNDIGEEDYEDFLEVIYFRHLIIGIKYWIYNLYGNKQISIDELNLFLESLNNLNTGNVLPEFWEMELLFNVLNTSAIDWYFSWQNWDFIEHKEGRIHSLPSVFDWIYNGYIVDVIQNGEFLSINNSQAYDVFKEKLTPTNKKLFLDCLKKGITNAIHQLNSDNQYIIKENIKKVEEDLSLLSMKSEIEKATAIVTSKLSNEKIELFKANLLDNWISSQMIHKIFNFYQNKIPYNGDQKLLLIGQNMFLEGAKFLFLDNMDNQNILGLDRIGKQLSKWENDIFFQTVLDQKSEVLYPSFMQGVNKSIKKLEQLGKFPSVLFISSFTFLNELKKDEKWRNEMILDVFKGMYNNISVCFVNSSYLQNKFIISDFKNAFQMLYRKKDNNFNDYLDVKINEITDEVALEKLTKNPTKWKNIEGVIVSDEEALLNIKTSIIIDYEIVELFEIIDFDALEIGIISDY
ncbi:hypothetical protein [Myroides injenensis]|uniref:hypothetical protein n=1 Tax=Myroides injenensis TaxID=1183151 RepID=UPI00227063CC|nr:hypothetical protein [Myroides injenensis]